MSQSSGDKAFPKKFWITLTAIALVILPATSLATRQARLSAVVAIVYSGSSLESWLSHPNESYVESYFRFPRDLPEDVIFGVDQEFIDGVNKPVFVSGGDWMSFVGLQRNGSVWVATGSEATMKGIPSQDRSWKLETLGQALLPETWYRVRCYSDFTKRKFRLLEVIGPNLEKAINLEKYLLDYPNHIPFDQRAMSYFVYAMRGRSMMKERGNPVVYFDDVTGSIPAGGSNTRVFFCDFESQKTVGPQPVTGPVIKLSNYVPGRLYLERSESRFSIIEAPFAHSGTHVGVANADID